MNTPIKYGPYGKYVEIWGVESDSRPGTIYTVARTADDRWSCGCPRWTRNASRPQCKHITHVKAWRTSRPQAIDLEPIQPMTEKVKKALSTFAAIEL
jgi:hypothetical protein